MAKYLISVQETYRADTETEATKLIEEAKKDTSFTLGKYNCTYKERKAKGEVIDTYYKVTLVKNFDDEKDPCNNVSVHYNKPEFAGIPDYNTSEDDD